MREGIAAVRNEPDMQLVAEASTGHEAIQGFHDHQPDVTLMDVGCLDMGHRCNDCHSHRVPDAV